MSNYTTGEIAKLAGITVRTVQYYDSRGILMPSDFSEGGRRLYTEKDLKKLKLICFLRELDIPINSISEILSSENAEKVVSLLLEQQLLVLQEELAAKEPSVIISRRPCALLKYVKHKASLAVEQDKCVGCKACMKIGCPAVSMVDGKAKVDNTLCTGCGVCAQLCKFDALKKGGN